MAHLNINIKHNISLCFYYLKRDPVPLLLGRKADIGGRAPTIARRTDDGEKIYSTGYGPSENTLAWYPFDPMTCASGLLRSSPALRRPIMWLKSYRGCQPSSFRARSFTYTLPMIGDIFQPRRS